jgi:AcrR family transcriptional regulator
MTKSKSTREAILDRAVAGASLRGLNALTIGTLAAELEMSKSGLFAHFGSKEVLQREVVTETFRLFTEQVVRPALALPPGADQLRALFENWIAWSLDERRPGGCPLAGAAFDIDGQPGEVRDLVAGGFRRWSGFLKDAIEKAKRIDLRQAIDADTLVLEIFGLYFAHHVYRWLMDDLAASQRALAAFDDLLRRATASA